MQTRPPKLELVPLDVRAENGQTEGLTFDNSLMHASELGAVIFELNVTEATSDLGSELVTNGSFTGNADGWTLGTGWAYAANAVGHTSGTDRLSQQVAAGNHAGTPYQVSFSLTGTQGTVQVQIGDNADGVSLDPNEVSAFAELFQADLDSDTDTILYITPSDDFDGTIDNVSVKEVMEMARLDLYLQQTLNGVDYFDLVAFVPVLEALENPNRALVLFQSENSGFEGINIGDTTSSSNEETNQEVSPFVSPDIRLKWIITGSVSFGLNAYPIAR